jgi:hypothetical protein
LVRAPLYVGLGVIAVALLFVLLVSDSDESEVEFDAMNATFEVGCTSPWDDTWNFDDVNPLTFSDGDWSLPTPYETMLDTRWVSLGEPVVADVVENSAGPEVVIELGCYVGNNHIGGEVHVFAGNSQEARRLGQPVAGSIERVIGNLGSEEFREFRWAFVSTRVWENVDNEARCCPSKYVIVKRRWKNGNWVETEREVWERTVHERG